MEKSYNQLEDYLDGNLSNEEISLMLKELECNEKLASELYLRLEVNQLIKDKGFFELQNKLNLQMNSTGENSTILNLGREFMKTWHLAAASFALVLVVGGLWYILSNKPQSTEQLVNKYYKPAHPILQIRSAESNKENAMDQAFKFYRENDFNNALNYFKSIENQITARFYSGVCLIELQQYNQAIESFVYVINDNDNLFVEQAEWYLGLIYLMDNQKNLAIKQFEKITVENSFYSAQANEILKYLN
jgi:tetratricopeptide (TPR) repeat protein